MRISRDTLRSRIRRLQNLIADPTTADYEVAIAESDLKKDEEQLAKVTDLVKKKECTLGIDGQRALDQFMSDPYINDRMNARVLKIHIRQKLASRKFERDRIERHLQEQINGKAFFYISVTLNYSQIRNGDYMHIQSLQLNDVIPAFKNSPVNTINLLTISSAI